MRESEIENYFVRRVREAGGLQRKFTSPGTRGVPDRIVAFRGRVRLVELKAPQGELSVAQEREHKRWTDAGIPVFVMRTKEQIDVFIKHYM